MNRNVLAAMERVERAQTISKQPRLGAVDKERMFASFYKWVKAQSDAEPPYSADSRKRDRWLTEAWMKEPHLAGVINSVVAIDRNRDWSLTGGRNSVNRYNNILRESEQGEGWRYFAGRAALSFYTSDLGAITEIGRDGIDGPARAFYNVDPTKCMLTSSATTPLSYTPTHGKEQLWQSADYFRTTPMPTIKEEFNGLGFCGLSRVWGMVQLLMAVYDHDMEKLGARAPKGLLLLQNIGEQQWEDAMKAREANLSKMERDYYGGVAILAQEGVDQIDAKLVALSQLPDGYDIRTITELIMVGIALGFGYDPIEFWPINQGALGRGRESEIQHQKATGKGGIEFVRTFQDRLQGELPPTLLFEFEQRDVSGELSDAQVQKAWADVFAVLYDKGAGILTADEVRQLMVKQGIIPAEWTTAEEQAQTDSTGEQRSWLNTEAVWRSVFTNPRDPIVRYSSKTNRTEQLAPSGYWLIGQHRGHPVARSVYDDMPVAEFRDVFSHRAFPVLTMRADDSALRQAQRSSTETLYDDDDITITTADVARAIDNARKRVGKEFADMLLAEPER